MAPQAGQLFDMSELDSDEVRNYGQGRSIELNDDLEKESKEVDCIHSHTSGDTFNQCEDHEDHRY